MPGFRVHITGSSIVGAGYGAAAWLVGDMPPLTCALGGGLCAVSGMLPDLDSGPGIPLRESVAFAAAVVPIMLIHRFQQAGLPLEATILAGAAVYLAIRFGLTWLLQTYAHHRGMFHSLPAAAVCGQIAFLVFAAEEPLHRYFVSSAVVLGFITHLVLDEIWSVKMGWFGPKVKKSFGTAMKFTGPDLWPNLLVYTLALVLGLVAAGDAAWTEKMALVKQQMAAAKRQMEQAARAAYQQPQQILWQYRR